LGETFGDAKSISLKKCVKKASINSEARSFVVTKVESSV
jgi:hypothetical protein